ncbi:hypothetical protein HYX14_03475 [Candidatus Woesearchaeota archaeon]|nr:hypothetical protein [Candidatus Woesearchaeota archaeon]
MNKTVIVVVVFIFIFVVLGILISKGGLTGAFTASGLACSEDADCDDKIAQTRDVCRNPGTEYSLCVNRPK